MVSHYRHALGVLASIISAKSFSRVWGQVSLNSNVSGYVVDLVSYD